MHVYLNGQSSVILSCAACCLYCVAGYICICWLYFFLLLACPLVSEFDTDAIFLSYSFVGYSITFSFSVLPYCWAFFPFYRVCHPFYWDFSLIHLSFHQCFSLSFLLRHIVFLPFQLVLAPTFSPSSALREDDIVLSCCWLTAPTVDDRSQYKFSLLLAIHIMCLNYKYF